MYVVTKLGLLFVYDLETATAVYRNRISPDPIFLAASSDSTGGIVAINRQAAQLLGMFHGPPVSTGSLSAGFALVFRPMPSFMHIYCTFRRMALIGPKFCLFGFSALCSVHAPVRNKARPAVWHVCGSSSPAAIVRGEGFNCCVLCRAVLVSVQAWPGAARYSE